MKNMTRVIALLLCFSMAFCLLGCGNTYLRSSDYSTCKSALSTMDSVISAGNGSKANLGSSIRSLQSSRDELERKARSASSGKSNLYTQAYLLDSIIEQIEEFTASAQNNDMEHCREVRDYFEEYTSKAVKTQIK